MELSCKKMAIEALNRGREFTKQLVAILHDQAHCSSSSSSSSNTAFSRKSGSEQLVVKILESLDTTISMLTTTSDDDSINNGECVPVELGGRSSDSSLSCNTSAITDRKPRNSDTWKRETSVLVDDGHSWRKYGQKVINGVKHHREYFRCTHKYDRRCGAKKWVQKIQDRPPKYRTTYCGRHTCKNLYDANQIVPTSAEKDSSILLSFGTNHSWNDKDGQHSSVFFPSVKQENKQLLNQFSPSDSSSFSHLMAFETFEPMNTTLLDNEVASHEIYSCEESYCDLEIDMLLNDDIWM